MKVYIDNDLPIERLNFLAKKEGNSKQQIYRIHKWWARRLGSVFRALILAALENEASDEKFWNDFVNGRQLKDKIIVDPFMGGGTTVIEGLRLGCNVIGLDVNPVAWFVTRKETELMDLNEINMAYKELCKEVRPKITRYYSTHCPNGHRSEAMYAFWIKKVPCSSCGKEVHLFPNYLLSARRNQNIVVCPTCKEVFPIQSKTNAKCPSCGSEFDPSKGVSRSGKYTCPYCSQKERRLEATKRIGHRLDEDLFAIEGFCERCGRFYKKAGSEDISLFENAKRRFHREQKNLLYPKQRIPIEGRNDPRPVNYGYIHFWDMFNERQLLCLSKLLYGIKTLDKVTESTKEFLLLAFSDCLAANNMFCIYETNWRKIGLAFGLRAFHPFERIAENNVWGTTFGRGTFTRCLQKLIRAKVSSGSILNYERHLREHSSSKSADNLSQVTLVSNFDDCQGGGKVILKCEDSRNLSFIPSASVDAVITDPPYFDNVMYSELADFFYVWLRLMLAENYPWFKPEYSSRKEELIMKNNGENDLSAFAQGLEGIFSEANRILNKNGRLVFTFHHNNQWAWKHIAYAIVNSGFNHIPAAHVVRSEGTTGFPTTKKNVKYDVCFVCKKSKLQKNYNENYGRDELESILLQRSFDWVTRTHASGLDVSEGDLYTIVYGQATKLWVSEARFQRKKLDTIYDLVPTVVRNIQKRLDMPNTEVHKH